MNEPKRHDLTDVEEQLEKQKKLLLGCVFWGCLIPFGIFFVLFAVCLSALSQVRFHP